MATIWMNHDGARHEELAREGGTAEEPERVYLLRLDPTEPGRQRHARWWDVEARKRGHLAKACVDCEDERGTLPGGRCRECDIDHVTSSGSCRECYVWIIGPDWGGPIESQHKAGCSLRTVQDYGPRTEAEYLAVREARVGWAPKGGT